MDLYTSTALQNTRHQDLLAEANAARLADDGTPRGLAAVVRTARGHLAGMISEVRSARVVRTAQHKAAANS